MSPPYEGDVSVEACWAELASNPDAVLVDVRTSAEWAYVGVPLVPQGGSRPVFAEWQSFPSMQIDPHFVARVEQAVQSRGGSTASPLYFLCRSGVRSMGSAGAMTQAGFSRCFNVLDGFEGPVDEEGHRGRTRGWKARNLPWAQK